VLAVSNFAKTAAHGILMSVSVLYFTRSVGIPAVQVGLALTVGAAMGMVASIPAGHAADLYGPRNTTVVFMCLLGVMVCGYAFVGGFAGLLVAAALVLMAESSTDAARGALVAGVVPPEERVRAWSYLRSVANIGVSVGAVAGGVGLYFGTKTAYVGLLLGAGVLFVVAGLAYLRLPLLPSTARRNDGPRLVVLRDKPYAAFALLNAILVMNGPLLTVALPIWIAQRTHAPTSVYSVIILINTCMVVLMQVRTSKGGEDVAGGARALRRSGVVLAVCCAVFALAAGQPAWLAVVILIAGAFFQVFGEMLYSVGSWSLAYGLAPEHLHGQYQGLFAMSTQLGSVVTPVAATTLILGLGWSGWLIFAAVLLAAGLSAPKVATWALRTRQTELSAADILVPSSEEA
jgi:MFS family permease